jgi:hypothetical protein
MEWTDQVQRTFVSSITAKLADEVRCTYQKRNDEIHRTWKVDDTP